MTPDGQASWYWSDEANDHYVFDEVDPKSAGIGLVLRTYLKDHGETSDGEFVAQFDFQTFPQSTQCLDHG